jgi:hypothetical protein
VTRTPNWRWRSREMSRLVSRTPTPWFRATSDPVSGQDRRGRSGRTGGEPALRIHRALPVAAGLPHATRPGRARAGPWVNSAGPRAPAGPRKHEDRQLAEPRGRQEVAREARARTVRANERPVPDGRGTVAQSPARLGDAGRAAAAVTHFHGEFKARRLDLYTDGNRWTTADSRAGSKPPPRRATCPDDCLPARNLSIAPPTTIRPGGSRVSQQLSGGSRFAHVSAITGQVTVSRCPMVSAFVVLPCGAT